MLIRVLHTGDCNNVGEQYQQSKSNLLLPEVCMYVCAIYIPYYYYTYMYVSKFHDLLFILSWAMMVASGRQPDPNQII